MTGLQWDNVNLDGSIAVLNGRMSKQLDGTHQYEDGLKNGDDARTIELDTVTVTLLHQWQHHQKQKGLIRGTVFKERDYIIPIKRNDLHAN